MAKATAVKVRATIKTARRPTSEMTDQHGDVVVQLATRVKKQLYRELKLCAVSNSESISELVSEGIGYVLAKRNWKSAKKAS